MCGIAGITNNYEGDYNKTCVMLNHQNQRGPDFMKAETLHRISIGHNRLSILDTSEAGNQPMSSERWTLSYVGEIYNHMELRQKLGPMHWSSHCDTLTLLNCIEHKGIDWTLQNIEGMFAFSAYDKFEQKLYLAVDHMGIKPLHWIKTNKYFAFASSPGALTHLKDKWTFDRDALNDYLALGATYQPLFSGMKKLMPGHKIVYDLNTEVVSTSSWYEPKIYQNVTEEDLIECVKESIRSVKIADVPVFMFLSGGIDSSVVASQCYGMNAVHLASPEEKYAREVAEKYNNTFHLVHPSNYDARECLEDYSLQSGDCSMAAIIPYIVSKEVNRLGVKVAISSNGADELFAGYNRIISDATMQSQLDHIFRWEFAEKCSSWSIDAMSRRTELKTYVQFDLNKTLDFASMCHGVEIRVPYLNRKVVEMALSLSFEKHVKGNRRKVILKDFLQREGFSNEFVNRPKLGFSLYHEPVGYETLKAEGIEFLKNRFEIAPKFRGQFAARDIRYYEASAAAFLCWYKVWQNKLS